MARRLVAGRLCCPWCPKHVWIGDPRNRRAYGNALRELGRHCATRHAKSFEDLYAKRQQADQVLRGQPRG